MDTTASSPATAVLRAEELRQRQRHQRRATPLWTLASLLFHTAVFVALVLFTPMRELVLPEPKEAPPPTLSADRLEELAETIEDIQRSDLQAYVEELELTRAEMDTVREEMLEDYADFAERQAETAPETLATFIEEAAKLQRTALELQAAAAKDSLAASAAQQEVASKQVLAKDTLDKAHQRAQLTGMAKTVEALTQAAQVQQAANDQQSEAQRSASAARAAQSAAKRSSDDGAKAAEAAKAGIEKREQSAAKATAAADTKASAEDRAAKTAATLDAAKAAAQQAQASLKQAQQAEARAKKERNADAAAQAATAAKAAQTETERATAAVKKATEADKAAQSQAKQADAAARDAAKAAADANAQQERRTAEAAQRQERTQAASNAAAAALAQARDAQGKAMAEQQRAADLLKAAAQAASAENPAPQVASAPASAASLPPEIRRMDVSDLYATARALETKVTETYRDVRAAEVAMLRAVPIELAKELTDVAQPVRPDLDAEALRGAARTAEVFERRKETTATAIREAQGMVEASRALLDQARTLAQDGTAFNAEGLAAMLAQNSAVAEAAAENEAVRAKDLSALMRGAEAPQAHAAPAAPAGAEAPPEATETPRPPSTSDDGRHIDRSTRHPLLDPQTPNQNPGTIVGENNVATSWMYVDAWYVLGPFANPDRSNIDRKFPPETVVDLDAGYLGKGDRVIRWTYHKSPGVSVIPENAEPYGIWYAYAELFFPEACDRWIAVGSDDKSKIWINDTLVWESVPWHKSWRINEGYRRVHFHAGRNRVLYRVENGHLGMSWSLSVYLGDE